MIPQNVWNGNSLLTPPLPAPLLWPRPGYQWPSPPAPAVPAPGLLEGGSGGALGGDVSTGSPGSQGSSGSGGAAASGSKGNAGSPSFNWGRGLGIGGTALSALTGVTGLGTALGAIGTGVDLGLANAALDDAGLGEFDYGQLGLGDYIGALGYGLTGGLLGTSVNDAFNSAMSRGWGSEADIGGWSSPEAAATAAGVDGAMGNTAGNGMSAEMSAAVGIDGAMGNTGGGGGDGGGGSKIICNELHRQGLMPDDIWAADEQFGEWLREHDPDALAGYLVWAPWVVRQISGAGLWATFVRMVTLWIVTPWSRHMAYKMGALPKDNLTGRCIMAVGRFWCRSLGESFPSANERHPAL